jgi:Fe-S cluster assembly protein SufD
MSHPSTNDWYVSQFQRFEKSLNGEATSRLHALRKAAIAKFAAIGFPSTRDEDWRHTDISPIASTQFAAVLDAPTTQLSVSDIEPFTLGHLTKNLLVCVNGRFAGELSTRGFLPPGLKVGGLASASATDRELIETHLAKYARYDENGFVALSTAFLRDGAFVYVPEKTVVDEPIHILFVSAGTQRDFVANPRTLVIVGANSQISFVESHVSLVDGRYFTNTVAEIVVGENSIVEFDTFQNESMDAYHVRTTTVNQSRSSTFTSNAITFGGAVVRNNITAMLDGEGAEATLNGLYLAAGTQLIDNHTAIDHAKPHCNSHELYKGILAGKSKGVFNGKIFVRKDAQKTDAKQTNKNLILSDEASIDTKPQLEIFANDVKCTHGATIGQLDDEQLFYLRARAIGLAEAKDMLIFAFASDVVERIKIEPLRARLSEILHQKLDAARIQGEL